MKTGKFIVLEGLEGAGKSTIRDHLSEQLHTHGILDMVFTREPGGTPVAERLRQLIKQGESGENPVPMAELLMLYAARVQLVQQVIQPALQRGCWVIGDRHDLSSQAYQGAGRALTVETLITLRQLTLGDFRPDLTFYLDVTPEQGLARARERGNLDRIEQESVAFFTRVRQRYLTLAAQDKNIIVIDAMQPLMAVKTAVTQHITSWLSELA